MEHSVLRSPEKHSVPDHDHDQIRMSPVHLCTVGIESTWLPTAIHGRSTAHRNQPASGT